MGEAKQQPADVCRGVWLARQRQLRDLDELPEQGYEWRPEAGLDVVDFLEKMLIHWQGPLAGTHLRLEPWQKNDLILPLFGWFRKDGTRRFRQAYIEIPRKNGKTFICGGLALYGLVGDDEPGAEVYSVANKKDQARRCWEDAANSLNASPFLQHRLKRFHSTIRDSKTASRFSPLSSESNSSDGLNTHLAILDELHEWRDSGLLEKITTSQISRRQPLCIIITTAGISDSSSVAWKTHSYGQKVLENSVSDEAFFSYISSADVGDDVSSPLTWRKANPNLGVTLQESSLAEEWKRREAAGSINSFSRYYLNKWVSSQDDRAVKVEEWDAKTGTKPSFEGPCFIGIYAASQVSLNAISVYFPDSRSVLMKYFCPAETVDSRESNSMLQPWLDSGQLIVTPGGSISSEAIALEVERLAAKHSVLACSTDRINAHDLVERLERSLGDGFPVWRVSPSMGALNAGTKLLLTLIRSGTLAVGDNQVLRYQMSQLSVKTDAAGSKAPDRKASGDNISGVIALILALDGKLRRWGRDAQDRKQVAAPSVYEERGPLFIQM